MPATDTNTTTRRAATQPDAMQLGQTILLGTLLSPEGPSALLRLSWGPVRRVKTGDRIAGARIVAIEDGKLHLADGGETRTLRIPGN